eukprot:4048079-Pyramimonas_sp.AAC.1
MPDSPLNGNANLFVMPNLDAAFISYQMVKRLSDTMEVRIPRTCRQATESTRTKAYDAVSTVDDSQ